MWSNGVIWRYFSSAKMTWVKFWNFAKMLSEKSFFKNGAVGLHFNVACQLRSFAKFHFLTIFNFSTFGQNHVKVDFGWNSIILRCFSKCGQTGSFDDTFHRPKWLGWNFEILQKCCQKKVFSKTVQLACIFMSHANYGVSQNFIFWPFSTFPTFQLLAKIILKLISGETISFYAIFGNVVKWGHFAVYFGHHTCPATF